VFVARVGLCLCYHPCCSSPPLSFIILIVWLSLLFFVVMLVLLLVLLCSITLHWLTTQHHPPLIIIPSSSCHCCCCVMLPLLSSSPPFGIIVSASLSISPCLPSCEQLLTVVEMGTGVVIVVSPFCGSSGASWGCHPLAPAFHPASSCSQWWRWVLGWSLWCPPFVVHWVPVRAVIH
jgi:hypothetical protein